MRSVRDLFSVAGRTAIVTGGTRGLGRAISQGLASAGANVVLTGRTAESTERAAAEVTGPGTVIGVAAHSGEPEQMSRLVQRAVDAFGGLDIVVNNAGISIGMTIDDLTAEAYQKSFDVNLLGPLMLIKEALPHLERSECGSVINITTSGLARPYSGLSVYLGPKAGLAMMTKTLAVELGPRRVRVNAIAPGMIETDMLRHLDPERRAHVLGGTPLGRVGEPAELVGAVIFLASAASSFVTGHTITVDGGLTLQGSVQRTSQADRPVEFETPTEVSGRGA